MIFLLLSILGSPMVAQNIRVSGKIVEANSGNPVDFVSVLIADEEIWTVSDENGYFTLLNVPEGRHTVEFHCLGYVKTTRVVDTAKDFDGLVIEMKEDNLLLEGAQVVATKTEEKSTTSYLIDRNALDHQQALNINDIATLLPGGKTINGTLVDDSRLLLRSSGSEKGNASFGTAIEIDGIRLDNNAMMDETMGASTRNVSSSNIESVEIVTGIPSVEYGDLSNGVVKINVRKGKSPWIVEASTNPHTKNIAVNKGLQLGKGKGVMNLSAEHTKSFSDIASPTTAYQRNILSLRYSNTLLRATSPLAIEAGLTGNLGGYSSKADPDEMLDSYSRARDNLLRGNISIKWLVGKRWLTNLSMSAAFSLQDKMTENYSNASSASTQPYIHTTEEKYAIASDFETDPDADIILGPTGYWYVRSYNDQKPYNISLKGKADWSHNFGNLRNTLSVGGEYKRSGNNGRGLYYEEPRLTPTWREYRYDRLPSLDNIAFYAEDKVGYVFSGGTELQLTAGIREDVSYISGSDYGTVCSFSPRVNLKYTLWAGKDAFVNDLGFHAGMGRSVKLPSFQILYPAPSYSDILAFTPGSTANNKAYYAYYTFPTAAIYNPSLSWQYTDQTDIGMDIKVAGTRISISGFYNKTSSPYMSVRNYTPFAYRMTGQSSIEGTEIPSSDRRYSIDQKTGVVTMYDARGYFEPKVLDGTERHTYNISRQYTNGSPVKRWGLEWVIDFSKWEKLNTVLRLDGNFYSYKGLDNTLFASSSGTFGKSTDPSYPLLGWYRGSSSTSAGTVSSASISNGSESREVNLNATFTTHIPKIRMIVTLRLESALYTYDRQLSELPDKIRSIVLEDISDNFGKPYDPSMRNCLVAVYPEYYSTWNNPSEKIPFAEALLWAKDNDKELYNQLAPLVVKSAYAYVLNPGRISPYFSANFSVTKEIGDHISISFYANNFFNNMGQVKNTKTGLKSSLFGSGYIPKYYYGLSLRLKM